MTDCIARQYGCGCDKCRADIHIPPPRRHVNEVLAFVITAIVLSCAAYVGLERAERAYQQEQRV